MTEQDGTTRKQARLSRVDVLVVDYQHDLHRFYEQTVPAEHTTLCVPDTRTALAMLGRLPGLRVIIVQGHSRYDVDRLLTQGPDNTFGFLRSVVEAGFRGRFLVVSTMIDAQMRARFPQWAPWRLTLVEKRDFFARPQDFLTDDLFLPFPARDELWAEWELQLVWKSDRSARYLEQALSWLEGLDVAINAGDTRAVNAMVFGAVEPIGDRANRWCDCPAEDVRSLSWWHEVYHRLLNRAVWETVTAVPGLAGGLRGQYAAELAAAPQYWAKCPDVLELVQRRHPLLLEFLRPEGPGDQWFKTISASPEA